MRRVMEFVAGLLEARRLAWLQEIPSLRRLQGILREEADGARPKTADEEKCVGEASSLGKSKAQMWRRRSDKDCDADLAQMHACRSLTAGLDDFVVFANKSSSQLCMAV